MVLFYIILFYNRCIDFKLKYYLKNNGLIYVLQLDNKMLLAGRRVLLDYKENGLTDGHECPDSDVCQ